MGIATEVDSALEFAAVGVIRNIDYTLGAPLTKWRAGGPESKWQADTPSMKWRAGGPDVGS